MAGIENSHLQWERNASFYIAHRAEGNDPVQDVLNTPALVKILPRIKNCIALDQGCGDGIFTKELARIYKDGKVHAIDRSGTLVQYARQCVPDTHCLFYKSDIAELPFPSGYFDLVVSKMVLPSLPDIRPVIEETWRVLKDNGLYIISTLNDSYYFMHTLVRQYERGVNSSNPWQVVTPVAGSDFTVTTYWHTDSERDSVLSQGFEQCFVGNVVITEEFAERHERYKGRVKTPIITNYVYRKLSPDEIRSRNMERAQSYRV